MAKYFFAPACFLSFILLVSCKEDASNNNKVDCDSVALVMKKMPSEILLSPHNVQEKWYNSALGLSDIKNSRSDFELRLSEDYLRDSGCIVNIARNVNSAGSATLVSYRIIRDEVKGTKKILLKNITLSKPKSGWQKFIDRILSIYIKNIEIQPQDIPYFDIEPLISVLEVVKNGSYFRNYYTNVYNSSVRNEQEANVFELLEFIVDQFDIKDKCCFSLTSGSQ